MVIRFILVGCMAAVLMAGVAFVGDATPAANDGIMQADGVGDCVSACQARRQAIFQKCKDAGNPPDECAHRANDFSKRCKARCKARR